MVLGVTLTVSSFAQAMALFKNKQLVSADDDCLIYPGKPTAKGYGQLEVGPRSARKAYLAHRVAYQIAYGPIPSEIQIDHKCRNRKCVNPEHLRLATGHRNQQNRSGADVRSTTGFRGVVRHRNRFQARVTVAGKCHYGGSHPTAEAAAIAAAELRRKLMPFSEMDKQVSA